MLGPAKRALYARKEHRRRLEAFAIGDDAGRDLPSRFWASDHDQAHWALPARYCCVPSIPGGCELRLTQRRPYRDRYESMVYSNFTKTNCALREEPGDGGCVGVE